MPKSVMNIVPGDYDLCSMNSPATGSLGSSPRAGPVHQHPELPSPGNGTARSELGSVDVDIVVKALAEAR